MNCVDAKSYIHYAKLPPFVGHLTMIKTILHLSIHPGDYCPKASIKRLDKQVVSWFSWSEEAQSNAMNITPSTQSFRDEHTAIIYQNPTWQC